MSNNPGVFDLYELLRQIPTATLSAVLRQRGVARVWMSGPKALVRGQRRVAGQAFTVRFVPAREDITTAESLSGAISFRAAIEQMPEGSLVVADAMAIYDAGVVGDILCARMKVRKVAGLVTDGSIRDLKAILALEFPVWCSGTSAPPSLASLHYAEAQTIIGCGGVAICPGDIVVADDDGAIVIPVAMAHEVAKAAVEKEKFESWVLRQVQAGSPLKGLYPPSEETKQRFKSEQLDSDTH